MECPSCGATNPEGKKFCGDCGTPLSMRCGACGAENPPGKKFCSDCGAALTISASIAPADLASALPEPMPSAERRQLTVMFCDLVGSTALSGRLDPEDYRDVITSFQRTVSASVGRFDGHVAKFLGDGVLAYFGYPLAHEDDADRAVRSSLAMLEAVRELEVGPRIKLNARVGIATGLVVVGDISEGGVSEEGAISGETPNLAARLQGAAEPGGVVICPSTRQLIGGMFDCEDLGPQTLKGIATARYAWRVVRERHTESRFDARLAAALTEFVGRADEMEFLLRRWDRAKKGEGQVVLVSGEAGIGKSRLARQVREHMADEHHTLLRYQCSPHHSNSALYPITSQLTSAAGFIGGEADSIKLDKLEMLLAAGGGDMTSVGPLLADLLSIPFAGRYPALDLTPRAQKVRTFEALIGQLLGLAKKRPVLAVFEDLHWLDPTTQELLDLMVDRIQSAPVLALMTFRPEYQPKWIGQAHVALLAMSRLTRRECAEMVRKVAATAELAHEALDEIVAKTEGSPLYIEELTRALLEGGKTTAIPATIQGSLHARLDRLGPAKQVAQVGAVIGRTFDHHVLNAVARVTGKELHGALKRLTASELIFSRGTPPDATYTFKHALVQDVAYESLLRSRRRAIHADVAEALKSRFPLLEANEPEIFAHHYTQAGFTELGVHYWERAGNRALERSANQEAVAHFRAGLALVNILPQGSRYEKELGLQIGLGTALTGAKGYSAPETGAAYRRARELCREIGDRKRLFPVMYCLWNFDNGGDKNERAKKIADELLQLADQHGESGPLIAAYSALGTTLTFMGAWFDANRNLEKCIDLYDPGQHASLGFEYAEDPCVQAYLLNAVCLWNLGYPDRAISSLHRATVLAKQLQHANSTGYVLTFVPMLHSFVGDAEAALVGAEACLVFAKETEFPYWGAWARVFRGWGWSRRGNSRGGISEIQSGIQQLREASNSQGLTMVQCLLADACMAAGEYEDARRAVDAGIRIAEERGEGFRQAELFRLNGLVLSKITGDSDDAEKCFTRALELAQNQQSRSMELRASIELAKLWHEQGKTREARNLIAPIHDWFTEGFDTPDLKNAKRVLVELNR